MYSAYFLHESANRKPHDVIIIADNAADKHSAAALNGVTAGFVDIFSCRYIIFYLTVAKRIKMNLSGFDKFIYR